MGVPEMPWYEPMEEALQPLNPYTTILLVLLGAFTIYVALRGDSIGRMAWLVYLVSP